MSFRAMLFDLQHEFVANVEVPDGTGVVIMNDTRVSPHMRIFQAKLSRTGGTPVLKYLEIPREEVAFTDGNFKVC